jgi:WD40 repeat protein
MELGARMAVRDGAPFKSRAHACSVRAIPKTPQRRADRAVTDTKSDIPSVVERTRPFKADAPVVAAHFLGQIAVFVLGEEALMFVPKTGDVRTAAVHGGAILCSTADTGHVVTGGDDGKVVSTDAEGDDTVVATDGKRRWIDHVAVGPNGAVAWSAGKQAFARSGKGPERMLEVPSTVGGLAFAPKGVRLAIAHYNGVTLWFANAQSAPETLEWKGSHLAALVSPDGRFVVTSMQESTLHGWRLADRKDMRMSGYSARVRSLDWTAGGKWLATSGSTQLILWPFQAKDGPMGKTPRILAPAEAQVEIVACHPKQEVVAVGYADGLVLLVRIDDGAEVLARRPGDAPVTALAWSATGNLLAVAAEDGTAGVIDLA